jgi:hypothetical protein
MGEWDDAGFSQIVTDEFKRKLKFGAFEAGRPYLIEEIPMGELIRRNPRRGYI